MSFYPASSRERAMKAEEVILRALSKQITFWQAARILRISPRHLRRIYDRYRRFGFDGLYDRRRSRPSQRRVPLAVVEQVLRLYRETYFDLSVRHFHEKLQEEHGLSYSYTWVKLLLQGAVWSRRPGSAGYIGGGASGGRWWACCCTSTPARIAGWEGSSGTT
jgi:transposase